MAHVLNRLSFGARPGDYERVRALAEKPIDAARAYIEEQLAPERIEDAAAQRELRRFSFLRQPAGEMFEYKERHLLEQMVLSTILHATYSERQLYEVMTGFWTDHFNIDPSKGDCRWLKAWDDQSVIRKYALGDAKTEREPAITGMFRAFGLAAPRPAESFHFPDFLRASALSPAMLWYLDGRVNRKAGEDEKPNENYARELLELHTLGVHGGYTQQDVMEVARCLTGWTVRQKKTLNKAAVEFKARLHDDGAKTVLGHTIPPGLGEKDLDRVLEIVALHPSTARHLATKLCRRFIADEPGERSIAAVARAFLDSGGDIRSTLRAVFDAPEFWSARGGKFKRPFHFVVSTLRATDAEVHGGRVLEDFLLRMGQLPFHYPTPDGYPEEPAPWMGTLLWRWNFAAKISAERLDKQRPADRRAATGETGRWRRTIDGPLAGTTARRGRGGRVSRLGDGSGVVPCLTRLPTLLTMATVQSLVTGNGDLRRTLIVVFLRGGADGLNMVAPLQDDGYYRARPRIAIKATDAIQLDDFFGLNPILGGWPPGTGRTGRWRSFTPLDRRTTRARISRRRT
ncbi:MAG: DUF1800 family protein [Rhodobacteraceae bacterium]|nr:DUF1800 family protein [Paracoccaceae bacterium]